MTPSGERLTSWLRIELGRLPPAAAGLAFCGEAFAEDELCLEGESLGDSNALIFIFSTDVLRETSHKTRHQQDLCDMVWFEVLRRVWTL